MKIGVSSTELSVIDLSMISYWKIRARLLHVPQVANVAMWGERLRMMQVQADPQRLFANGITLETVMETTADALDVGLLQFSPARPSALAASSKRPTSGSPFSTSRQFLPSNSWRR